MDVDDDLATMMFAILQKHGIRVIRRAHDVSVREASSIVQNAEWNVKFIIFAGSLKISQGFPGFGDSVMVFSAVSFGGGGSLPMQTTSIEELAINTAAKKLESIRIHKDRSRRRILVHTIPQELTDEYGSTQDVRPVMARLSPNAQVLVVNDLDPRQRGYPIPDLRKHYNKLVVWRDGTKTETILGNMMLASGEYDSRLHKPLVSCNATQLRKSKAEADVVVLLAGALTSEAVIQLAFTAAEKLLIVVSRQVNAEILSCALNSA